MSAPRRDTRRIRRVSDEERALWRAVNRETRHVHDRASRPDAPTPAPVTTSALALRSETPAPAPADVFHPASPGGAPLAAFTPRRPEIDALHDSTPGLDRKTARALRKGRRDPDARIDLHGMTLDRAHDALVRFVQSARAGGSRCVLVITGKGGDYRTRAPDGGMRQGHGVLRRDVPRWLRSPPLSGAVTGIFPAHGRHGGEGALYVYLRKSHG